MATLINRMTEAGPRAAEVTGYRMYPDSAAIIKLRLPGEKSSIVNVLLDASEADRLAEALSRNLANTRAITIPLIGRVSRSVSG